MAKINEKDIIGNRFEDMNISEMMLVQGSGDVSGEFTTSPACVALSVAFSQHSSEKCAGAITAISGAVSGVVISVVKC